MGACFRVIGTGDAAEACPLIEGGARHGHALDRDAQWQSGSGADLHLAEKPADHNDIDLYQYLGFI